MTPEPLTGRTRTRKTTRRVQVAETVSRWCITVGGLGTIVAVSAITIFLVWVVAPLFGDAETGAARELAGPFGGVAPAAFGTDEQQLVGWALLPDGTAVAFEVATGAELERRHLFDGAAPAVLDVSSLDGTVAAGFPDGAVRFARVGVAVEFITEAGDLAAIDDVVSQLEPGERFAYRRGLAEITPELQVRYHALLAESDPPLATGQTAPIVRLDHVSSGDRRVLATLRADGELSVSKVRRKTHLLTGEVTLTATDTRLPYEPRPGRGPPEHVLVDERGATVYVAWADGFLLRFDVASSTDVTLAESVNLLPGREARITALEWLLGRGTLVVGDSAGAVRGWFLTRPEGGARTLTLAHEMPVQPAAVTALAASARGRVFAAGYADGAIGVHYMPTDAVVVRTRAPGGVAVHGLALAPRADGLLALTGAGAVHWLLDAPHPETSPAALFAPVWYEGESEPVHVWQSSGGSDDFEPKLGLVPLVFGTLKATFYSMVFSVPLAILAAIYTSEFLVRRARARVKQAIEMMATLPSVVLGFLAALWLAPLVEDRLAAVLAAFLTVPFTWLAGAYLWQLLPAQRAIRLAGWPRLLVITAAVPLGVALAAVLGPLLEALLFGGDLQRWLAGGPGGATGGWAFLLTPVSACAAAWLSSRYATPALRAAAGSWPRRRLAWIDFGKFAAAVVATLLLAWLAGALLAALGLDPRGGLAIGQLDLSPTGTYVQRNALVVGFVMGFAVVPIIYTLAEDALSSVPEHLRAASLATGATPWQTAVRVIVPTAMSGLFSAVMIGLGRAVGETMVVLMAAGNTPLLEANLFNGFRTLSANIAVELPEAVQGGTLYRVLFLAALTLFAMTFAINTLAELVRQRFRRRAYEL